MGLDRAFEAASLFGLTPLAARALAERPRPHDLGLIVPADLADIPKPTGRHKLFDPQARRALANQLEAAIAPLGPHVAVLDSIRSLAEDGATCIVAGQQPGLFGGPLFNTYKALHVAKLARDLSRKWGRPVVPILWNHADDHDIAEVHHAWLVNEHVDLVKLHLSGTSSGRTPLAQLICDHDTHELEALRARLADVLAHEPHADEAVELAMPRHGESLARAWTRLHLELFGHLGVVVVEPDWIRNQLSEALAELVAPAPLDALESGARRLINTELDVSIDARTAALVFHVARGERHALRPGGDGWQFDNEPGSRSPAELAAEVIGDKPSYNAGALLRPLVQDMALPVSAYVGGLGELAYHAQLAELRQERGLEPGVFVPRLSCTLTDARSRSALRRIGLDVGGFVRHPTPTPTQLPRAGDDPSSRLRAAGTTLRAALLQEHAALDALDPRLWPHLKRTANQARNLVDQLAERVARTAANEDGSERRARRRLQANLWPQAKPQERLLTTVQVVARFGRTWIDELFEATDALPLEHLVAHIDPHQ